MFRSSQRVGYLFNYSIFTKEPAKRARELPRSLAPADGNGRVGGRASVSDQWVDRAAPNSSLSTLYSLIAFSHYYFFRPPPYDRGRGKDVFSSDRLPQVFLWPDSKKRVLYMRNTSQSGSCLAMEPPQPIVDPI